MGFAQAEGPVVKVDFDEASRQESEVNEPDYYAWPIDGGNEESQTIDSVTFTLKSDVGYQSHWYKAGVQAPNYARLANDGIVTSSVTLEVQGLKPGRHTLLAFHNTFDNPDNNTFSPIDVYLNDEQQYDDLVQSNRVTANDASTTSYLVFNVQEGETVKIRYEAESTSSASQKIVALCGFELNTANAKNQAKQPYPGESDEHANADDGSLTLKWTPAEGAVSHDVYFGTSASAVASADKGSPLFMGNQADTTYDVSGLSSMEKYYWRIDEVDENDSVTRGDVWYFRPRHLAFPGAEGYGKYALGGRGGVVVEVTNLNDDGPGSLREAVRHDVGPRTIVFNVSGIITLESRLTLNQSYITIAGQTAPGKGVCIRKAPFGMSGVNDVIMQHMRIRLGAGTTYDGTGMNGANHCIIDHSSVSWTIDESFSSRDGKNLTLQRTLIAEALNAADHSNYPSGSKHGYAASISGDIGSFHHNLLAHCYGRNWSLAGGLDGNGIYAGRLDIFNNVVYNFGHRTTDGGAHEVNFVNNYYKPGPGSDNDNALNAQYDNFPGTQRYYFAGNIMEGEFGLDNQEAGRDYSGNPQGYSPWVDEPFFPSQATIHTAKEAYKNVLSDVGCTQPVFDDHDVRMIDETLEGSYTYVGSRTGIKGMPDSEQDVGGWENYPALQRGDDWDADHDGMPGWWEEAHGLNPNSAPNTYAESHADLDGDGYTNLEEYLMWMANPHYMLEPDSSIMIDLAKLSRGYTNNPVYSITKTVNGTADVNNSNVTFTPENAGFGSFTFQVEDGEGSTFSRKIGIYSGPSIEDTVLIPTEPDTVVDAGDPKILGDIAPPDEWKLSIYPNPATTHLYIKSNKAVGQVSLRINSPLGERMVDREIDIQEHATIPLDIHRWASGLYFIEVNTQGGKQVMKVYIK